MYHKTIIVGRVGKAPVMRYTSSGVGVCEFSVAVNEYWTDKNNEKQERTTWYSVKAWRQLAETCAAYVKKGSMILVDGNVSASAYVAQDGEARANLELTAREVKFLGGGREQAQDDSYDDLPQNAWKHQENDDIPF